jgi:hypothetical protein
VRGAWEGGSRGLPRASRASGLLHVASTKMRRGGGGACFTSTCTVCSTSLEKEGPRRDQESSASRPAARPPTPSALQTGSGRTLAEHRAHARRHARTQTKCAMRISTSFTAAASVSCQRPESLDQIFPRNSSWHATCRAHGRARQSGPQIHSEPPPTLLVFSVLSPSSTTTECELL